jgi:hypothetical protein
MYKHCVVQHSGQIAEFEVSVVGSFTGAMRRQVNEGVRIVRSESAITLNSKSEWRQAPIVRVQPVRGLQHDQRFHLDGR